jgi:hypothetical protein
MLAFQDEPAAQPVINKKIKEYFMVFLKKGVGPSSNAHNQPIPAANLAVVLPGTDCICRHIYYSFCNLLLFH